MGRKLGKPRENIARNLTDKELAILGMEKATLIVLGTKEGFDIYDKNGKHQTLTELQRGKLAYFWEIPQVYPWEAPRVYL